MTTEQPNNQGEIKIAPISVEEGARKISDLAERLKVAKYLHKQELARNLAEREKAIQNEKRAAELVKDADQKVAGFEKDQASGGIKSEEGQKIVDELKKAKEDVRKSFAGIQDSVDVISGRTGGDVKLRDFGDSLELREDKSPMEGRSGVLDALHDEAQKEQADRVAFEQQLEKIKKIAEIRAKAIALANAYADDGATSIRALIDRTHEQFYGLKRELQEEAKDVNLRRAIGGITTDNCGSSEKQNILDIRSKLGLFSFKDRKIADRTIEKLLDSARIAKEASESHSDLYQQRIKLVNDANKIREEIYDYINALPSNIRYSIEEKLSRELGNMFGKSSRHLYERFIDFRE